MEHIGSSDRKTPLSEQAFAQLLEAQVEDWTAARPNRRITTDDGVPVVRRRRASVVRRGS